ncbi:unnamed protein product, partial [Mesorhabditis spiculigera]
MGVKQKHEFHISELNEKQKAKIRELRERLQPELEKYPEYDTELSLLRWLEGWDYDIEAILPKARWALTVFHNLDFHNFKVETIDDIHHYACRKSEAVEYFPGGLFGIDKEGDVVYCQPLAKADPRGLIRSDSVSQVFKLELAMIEGAFKLVRNQEAKTGKKSGMKIIMDLEGFSYSEHIYMPSIKEYLKLLSLVQAVFPDFLKRLWVVNPPATMSVVYNIIKPVLAKQTQEKIQILGKDWKEILVNTCGAENLYPQWGGTKQADSPFGTVRRGGKVPEKLHYSPSNNSFDDELQMQTLNVASRQKIDVKVHAKKGQEIHWLFRVGSKDIDFSVRFDDREVYPVFRVSTEFVPEMNYMTARETGEYALTFDNSHAMMWGKEIKYRVEVRDALQN